jgi:penicillin-binding protein 2
MLNPFQTEADHLSDRTSKIDKSSHQTWAGEDGIFNVATGEILLPPINFKKIILFYVIISVILLIFLSQIFYWQVVKGDYYAYVSTGRGARMEIVKAKRGLFFDRNLKPLVKNISNFSLEVIPIRFRQSDNKITLDAINQYLSDQQKKELQNNLNAMPIYINDYVTLVKELNYQQAILIQTVIPPASSIEVSLNDQRDYLSTMSMSHVLGYMGKISKQELAKPQYSQYLLSDFIGRSGLEAFYEQKLRGQNGQQRIDILPNKEEEVTFYDPPVNGNNLILTIDGELQDQLYNSLSKYVKANGNRGGAAVAMDPNTGEVLALTSYPSFDNTLISGGLTVDEFNQLYNNRLKPLFFRTIAGEYPSGSIIKPVVATGALEDGIITPDTTVLSTGGIRFGNQFFADWKVGGHGVTNVIKALAESVNTLFYYIGGGYGNFKGLGPNGLSKWMERFGLNKITGIDLFGENSGFVPTPQWKSSTRHQPWYPGDTYHLSIGQGDLLVTPLQVANYTSAVANYGILYRPYLVKKIIQSDDQIISEVEPKILSNNLASKSSLNIVREGMRAAVTLGSARSLASLPIAVAGKTGTAQVEGVLPHAWFTCFAPYDYPEIVLTILVENGAEGSVAATPVAREVLAWWAANRSSLK